MSKGLHVRAKIFIEVFWGAVICNQDTDVHPVHDVLGAETLEVLAYSHVRLSNRIWFIQDLFIEGEIGFKGKEDCGLINLADGSKELGEVEALNCHCCQVTPGFNCKNQIIIKFVDLGNRILEFRIWDRGSRGV